MNTSSRRVVRVIAFAFAIATVLVVRPVLAQAPRDTTQPPEVSIPVPEFASAIRLYPGVAPGSEGAAQVELWEQQASERRARNVTVPMLIPVLPAAGKANGTAVVVLPGGAFRRLAMDKEGLGIAELLAQHGVTAYVLKYRLVETPASRADMVQAMRREMASGKAIPTHPLAVADGRRAIQIVRENAGRWGLRPDRVGMVGFSAGAMTTLEVVLGPDRATRPDFAGIIYGPMSARPVADDAPPLFVALAADDPLFAHGDFGLVSAWQKAGRPVELHMFGQGGHGFGMGRQGLTSDLWAEQFLAWMRMRDLIEKSHLNG
jgi:acetyl esterase/lipase